MTDILRKLLLGAVITSIIFCVGCGTTPELRDEYRGYEKPSTDVENGLINVSFAPTPEVVLQDGQQIVSWQSPYRFNAQYISDEPGLAMGEITNLEIRSIQTGDLVYEEARIPDSGSRSRADKLGDDRLIQLLGFGAGPLHIPHDDYSISFDYVIRSAGGEIYDNGALNVVVRRKFFK